jgi:hypothetical protein
MPGSPAAGFDKTQVPRGQTSAVKLHGNIDRKALAAFPVYFCAHLIIFKTCAIYNDAAGRFLASAKYSRAIGPPVLDLAVCEQIRVVVTGVEAGVAG